VNAIDPDVAIVASIALDHCEWLGSDLESIGREKAGIFRPARPAIYGSRQMPASIEATATQLGAELKQLGCNFDFERSGDTWTWKCGSERLEALPAPALVGDIQYENAATVLTAVHALQRRAPVSRDAIERGLQEVTLAGRFQVFPGEVQWVLDVAHNPAAADTLARRLQASAVRGRTIGICGMLADKDSDGVIGAVAKCVDIWIPTNVSSARALSGSALAQAIGEKGGNVLAVAESVVAACDRAASVAHPGDRVIVFGSFTTVGPALEWLTRRGGYLHS
jgi:dihydrofolate synthase/folylpolyglutamate synthase